MTRCTQALLTPCTAAPCRRDGQEMRPEWNVTHLHFVMPVDQSDTRTEAAKLHPVLSTDVANTDYSVQPIRCLWCYQSDFQPTYRWGQLQRAIVVVEFVKDPWPTYGLERIRRRGGWWGRCQRRSSLHALTSVVTDETLPTSFLTGCHEITLSILIRLDTCSHG
jgi:hypothetical protein